MISEATQVVTYRPRGGSARLFRCRDAEVLLDGPGGTGKSRGTGEYINYLAETYPKCRILVVRKTRASLTESWMVTFEDKVLLPDSPVIANQIQRKNRSGYDYPNGSHIALGGLDQATRLFSTEYDLILVVEAVELAENEWEKLHRALRNNMIPHPDGSYDDGSPRYFQQLVGECNPDAEDHWLNLRCISGMTKRLLSKHADNPSLTPDYLDRLENKLHGVDKDRLFHGLWVTAEGAIWPNFQPSTHVLNARLMKNRETKEWEIYNSDTKKTTPIVWFAAGVDWGIRAPGCMMVYAVDRDRNVYGVKEWYHTEKDIIWWADEAVEAWKKYDIQRFICDSAGASEIALFNKRIREAGGEPIAEGVSKRKLGFKASASIVRERFDKPSLFFLADMLQHPVDQKLVADKKPTCTVKEIPSYCYKKIKEEQRIHEEPAEKSNDHGCDQCRYLLWWFDGNDYDDTTEPPKHAPDTFYEMLNHEDIGMNN